MKRSALKRLMPYVKPYTLHIIGALLCTLVSVLSALYITVLIGRAVDAINDSLGIEAVLTIIGTIGLLILVVLIFQYFEKAITNRISFLVSKDIRTDALKAVLFAPVREIDSRYQGDIISRVTADVTEISNGLLASLTQFFDGIVTIIATLVFMLMLNVWVALLVLLLTPLSLIAAGVLANKSYALFGLQSIKRGELTAKLDEAINNQKLIKTFNKEQAEEADFEIINNDLKKKSTKAVFVSAIVNPGTRLINNIVYLLVTLFGAYIAIKGGFFAGAGFTIGALTSCLLYASRYTKPFNEISNVIAELQSALASANRVFELTDIKPEDKDKDSAIILKDAKGEIEFNNVSFSYDNSRELIKDFNLKVKQGQRVAIVGKTGAGKTTLINLLMRFYDVVSGEIKIDGVNITDYTRESLRDAFGMVLQEPFVFEGTVKENIAFGNANASEKDIIAAAKSAKIHSVIMRMENGYDTVIGKGREISSGFKQLISVARVMVKAPPMLILDEATSSIDTRTEVKVQQAFDEMMTGKTSFVVAHRLSTIKNADVILYLEGGKIKEQGTHDELLAKGGAYYDLYKSQFSL